jgi:hypothetical protein
VKREQRGDVHVGGRRQPVEAHLRALAWSVKVSALGQGPVQSGAVRTTEAAGELDVLGLDGDALGVDGGEVGVLEERDEVCAGESAQVIHVRQDRGYAQASALSWSAPMADDWKRRSVLKS